MCGIATIAIGHRARGRVKYPLLRELSKALLVELQSRGMDASGIAVINAPGRGPSIIFKKPLRASRLVVRPKFQEALDRVNENTNFILLHTRATTVGKTEENVNNHPILTEHVVGIHNGTLLNEEELFTKFSLERKGEVDSEVIFRLYEHFVQEGANPQEAMKKTSNLLDGSYTGSIVDLRHPHRMLVFKNQRPLHTIYLPYYDILISLSEARFYDRAAKELKIKASDEYRLIEDGTGFIVDVNASEPLSRSLVDFEIPAKRGYGGYCQTYPRHHSNERWLKSIS